MNTLTTKKLTKTLKYDGFDVVLIDISYPELSCSGRLAQRFNRYYRHEAHKLLRFGTRRLYPMAVAALRESVENNYPFNPYELNAVYTVTLNDEKYISLYLDIYTYTGGAHGSTLRRSETWGKACGWLMQLQQFFGKQENCKNLLIANAARIAQAQIDSGQGQYFDDYEKLMRKNFSSCNFYLTDCGIVIYYQQYDIAPYSSGIPEFLYKTPI